ncbi:hypothetical protein HY469_05255, partial [Candidatus Roizmanbacteria bacterium]|nr:hypothetical protein [Candidatus Roizmanbacteria bacterium]
MAIFKIPTDQEGKVRFIQKLQPDFSRTQANQILNNPQQFQDLINERQSGIDRIISTKSDTLGKLEGFKKQKGADQAQIDRYIQNSVLGDINELGSSASYLQSLAEYLPPETLSSFNDLLKNARKISPDLKNVQALTSGSNAGIPVSQQRGSGESYEEIKRLYQNIEKTGQTYIDPDGLAAWAVKHGRIPNFSTEQYLKDTFTPGHARYVAPSAQEQKNIDLVMPIIGGKFAATEGKKFNIGAKQPGETQQQFEARLGTTSWSLNQDANKLFEEIKAGRIIPSKNNKIWTDMYQNGEATQAQKEAYNAWDRFMKQNPNYVPSKQGTAGQAGGQTYSGNSIVDFLNSIGQASDYNSRARLARDNGILNYRGTAEQNLRLLGLLQKQVATSEQESGTPGAAKVGSGDWLGSDDPQKKVQGEKDRINEEANNEMEKEAQAIEEETSNVDLSDSAELIQNLLDEMNKKAEEPVETLEQKFATMRAEFDNDPDVIDLAKERDRLRQLDADYASAIEGEEGRLVSMAQVQRRQSAEGVQYNRDRRDLIARIDSLQESVSQKLGVINTMVSLAGQDINNAQQDYQVKFNQAIQMINLMKGIEDSAKDDAERSSDKARANIQIMTNLLKEGDISYEDLDPATLVDIKKMEMAAGLPIGFTSFVHENIKNPVTTFLTAYTDEETGHRIQPVGTIDANGKWEIQNIDLGQQKSTGVSGGGGSTSVRFTPNAQGMRTDRHNNPIAAAVKAGKTNEFTKALEDAGIGWTYGDPFPNNPSMVTIAIQGDPIEGARVILANTGAIQNWYINHTGKSILAKFKVKNNNDFKQLQKADQDEIIKGI